VGAAASLREGLDETLTVMVLCVEVDARAAAGHGVTIYDLHGTDHRRYPNDDPALGMS
jgi:hypothetical protein